jgi:hypothetical protein
MRAEFKDLFNEDGSSVVLNDVYVSQMATRRLMDGDRNPENAHRLGIFAPKLGYAGLSICIEGRADGEESGTK